MSSTLQQPTASDPYFSNNASYPYDNFITQSYFLQASPGTPALCDHWCPIFAFRSSVCIGYSVNVAVLYSLLFLSTLTLLARCFVVKPRWHIPALLVVVNCSALCRLIRFSMYASGVLNAPVSYSLAVLDWFLNWISLCCLIFVILAVPLLWQQMLKTRHNALLSPTLALAWVFAGFLICTLLLVAGMAVFYTSSHLVSLIGAAVGGGIALCALLLYVAQSIRIAIRLRGAPPSPQQQKRRSVERWLMWGTVAMCVIGISIAPFIIITGIAPAVVQSYQAQFDWCYTSIIVITVGQFIMLSIITVTFTPSLVSGIFPSLSSGSDDQQKPSFEDVDPQPQPRDERENDNDNL